MFLQFGVGRGICLHVKMDDFLPPGDEYVLDGMGQLKSLRRSDLLPAGMNLLDDVSFLLCQELLRAAAGDSARAMVVPVNLVGGLAG